MPKFFDRMQIGAAVMSTVTILAFAAAHRRQVIVVAQGREHVLRRDVVGRQLRGVQPGAQRELTAPESRRSARLPPSRASA